MLKAQNNQEDTFTIKKVLKNKLKICFKKNQNLCKVLTL